MAAQNDASADDAAYEEALSDQARESFHAGRYKEAYGQFTASLLSSAIRMFREEGVRFARPPGELTPTELIVGLAFAANAELRERGDSASDKLSSATWLFSALAELRVALDEPVPLKVNAVSDKIAELVMRAFMIGQIEMIMNAVKLGWLDKLAQHEMDRERRRAGADATNAKKASIREQALGEVIRIAARNPTLSNEDMALKLRESGAIQTSVKTLTEWVREWRRQGFIDAVKKPGR